MSDKKPSTQASLEGSNKNEGDQSDVKDARQEKSIKKQIKKKFFAPRASVSSVDSLDLVRMNASPSTRKRWTTLDTAGRSLLVLSAVLLLAGIVITVFGFTDLHISPTRQLPMQIIGPACLMATAVMWVVGGVFCRLWSIEMKRQKHSMELRTRVQLHALAMDMLKKPQIFSSQALEDPRIRRQLLLKLRQQNALDTSSLDSNSRRSSRVPSIDARSRHSHSGSMAGFLPGFGGPPFGGVDRRRSTEASIGGGSIILPAQFDLPGIHISRIETLDFDDMSMLSGFGQLGPRRYIIIESDGSSEYSKMSIPNSECSFSVCSRSSRSRSSRDSSNFGSRIWDFSSPRESDWEVNAQYAKSDAYNYFSNARHASVTSQTAQTPGNTSFLSPSMPRKGSTVTFDANEVGFRRHSSPASSFRRKDGRGSASSAAPNIDTNLLSTVSAGTKKRDSFSSGTNGRNDVPTTWLFANQQAFYGAPTYRKKSAGDQSLMSIVIDENDGDEDEGNEDDEKDSKEEQNNSKVGLPGKETNVSSKSGAATTRAFLERRKQSVWEDPYDDSEKRKQSLVENNNNNNNNNDAPFENDDKITGAGASPLIFGQRKSLAMSPKGKSGLKLLRRLTGEKNENEIGSHDAENRRTTSDKYDRLNSGNESTSVFSNIAGSIISNLYNRSSETVRSMSKFDETDHATPNQAEVSSNTRTTTTTATTEKNKFKNFFSSFVK